MKIIDGEKTVLGRLSSFAAKEALKGEEIAIVNCERIIISGKKKMIEKEFSEKRGRFGQSQKGPKHSHNSEKIVKRTIRGMLPDFREGRGKEAFKKIRCYKGVPKEFEGKEMEKLDTGSKFKFAKVEEFSK